MQHCVLSQLLRSLMGVFPLELSPRDVKMLTEKMQGFFYKFKHCTFWEESLVSARVVESIAVQEQG